VVFTKLGVGRVCRMGNSLGKRGFKAGKTDRKIVKHKVRPEA